MDGNGDSEGVVRVYRFFGDDDFADLNDDPTMNASEETCKAILEAAGKLNYQSTRSRRGRTAKRPVCIGLAEMLSPTELPGDPYYLYLKNYVERYCVKRGYDIAYLRHANDGFQQMVLTGLDGIIAVGIFNPQEIDSLHAIHDNVVFLDSAAEEERSDAVVGNLRLGVQLALEDLVAHGYRQIGFIGPLEKLDDHKQPAPDIRRQCFITFMQDRGLFDPDLMLNAATDATLTYDAMRQYVESGRELPTAFLTHNEQNAIGAIRALTEAGITVPERISFIAFNDTPLTSISMHIREMSERAVRLLLERALSRWHGNLHSVSIKAVLPPELIARGSVTEIPAESR